MTDMMELESLTSGVDYDVNYDAVSETFTLTVNNVNTLTVRTAFFNISMT